jgi:CheY-like chemotaxis protein
LFPSAEAPRNCGDFRRCLFSDSRHQPEQGVGDRTEASSRGGWNFLPVIYITANENPAVRVAALASGCIAYLPKSFAARSLLEPIEKVSAGLA